MRLNTYLNEAVTMASFNKLLPDYSDILKIYKRTNGNYLYRSSDRSFIFASKIPRKLRRPKNTQPKIHTELDNLFYEEFGWKTRSEGLFVSTSRNTMFYGGNTYIIFPKNGFKYVYADGITDIYNNISNIYSGDDDILKRELKKLVGRYTDKGLKKLLSEGKGIEVTIKCDKYYSLLWSANHLELFNSWLKDLKI